MSNLPVLVGLLVDERGAALDRGADVARFDSVLAWLRSDACDLLSHGQPLRDAVWCVGKDDFHAYLAGTVVQAVESIMAGRGVSRAVNSSLRARLARCGRV